MSTVPSVHLTNASHILLPSYHCIKFTHSHVIYVSRLIFHVNTWLLGGVCQRYISVYRRPIAISSVSNTTDIIFRFYHFQTFFPRSRRTNDSFLGTLGLDLGPSHVHDPCQNISWNITTVLHVGNRLPNIIESWRLVFFEFLIIWNCSPFHYVEHAQIVHKKLTALWTFIPLFCENRQRRTNFIRW